MPAIYTFHSYKVPYSFVHVTRIPCPMYLISTQGASIARLFCAIVSSVLLLIATCTFHTAILPYITISSHIAPFCQPCGIMTYSELIDSLKYINARWPTSRKKCPHVNSWNIIPKYMATKRYPEKYVNSNSGINITINETYINAKTSIVIYLYLFSFV